jgi:hypothetical protein
VPCAVTLTPSARYPEAHLPRRDRNAPISWHVHLGVTNHTPQSTAGKPVPDHSPPAPRPSPGGRRRPRASAAPGLRPVPRARSRVTARRAR